MAAVCEQCRAADKPLAPSRHLAPLQFCGVACRDLYIGETHRYRPCPDRDTHCLVPVGAPLAELWRREVAPLLGQAPSVAATDYALHRGLVEPIAAALQRIGKNGVKRGRDATDTPLAASDGDDSDDDQPPAAPVPAASSAVVTPLMLHAAPSLMTLLAAATDDEVLRMWHAAAGTSLGRRLESPQFWEGRWRARLGDVFKIVTEYPVWNRFAAVHETKFVGVTIVREFVTEPYAVFGGLAVDASLRALFDLMVIRLRAAPHSAALVDRDIVQQVFVAFYDVALLYGSLPALRLVLTYRHAGVTGAILNAESIYDVVHKGVATKLVGETARQTFFSGIPWTKEGKGLPLPQNNELFFGHAAKCLRKLIDWRDELGQPADFGLDGSDSFLHESVFFATTYVQYTELFAQLARIFTDGDQSLMMKAIRTGDAMRANAILQAVPLNGIPIDLRNFKLEQSDFRPHLDQDKLALMLAWRHPSSASIGMNADAFVRQFAGLPNNAGQVSYKSFARCVPLLAEWRDPQTGAAVQWTRQEVVSAVMEGAAALNGDGARADTGVFGGDVAMRAVLFASKDKFITNVFMQNSSNRLINTFIRYLDILRKNFTAMPDTVRVVTATTFMFSLPPWTAHAFRAAPQDVSNLWLHLLKVRTVAADGSVSDVPAAQWVRANARTYFGKMLQKTGHSFADRYGFVIPQPFWEITGAPMRERFRLELLLRASLIKSHVERQNDHASRVTANEADEATRAYLAGDLHAAHMRNAESRVVTAYLIDGVPLEPTVEEAAFGFYRSAPLVAAPPASSLSAAAAASSLDD